MQLETDHPQRSKPFALGKVAASIGPPRGETSQRNASEDGIGEPLDVIV